MDKSFFGKIGVLVKICDKTKGNNRGGCEISKREGLTCVSKAVIKNIGFYKKLKSLFSSISELYKTI